MSINASRATHTMLPSVRATSTSNAFIFFPIFSLAKSHFHWLVQSCPPHMAICPAVVGVPRGGATTCKGRGSGVCSGSLRPTRKELLQTSVPGSLQPLGLSAYNLSPTPGPARSGPSQLVPHRSTYHASTPLPGLCPEAGVPSSWSDRGAYTHLPILSFQEPPPPGSPPAELPLLRLSLCSWQFSTARASLSLRL